ncbi:hypothetical protein KIN20_031562, partial [Parelaphostrongylus tenuis]
ATNNFTVTGFRVPAAMVFSTSSAFAQLPGGASTTSDGAKSFVSRLVMQTISYEPLERKTITVNSALDYGWQRHDGPPTLPRLR